MTTKSAATFLRIRAIVTSLLLPKNGVSSDAQNGLTIPCALHETRHEERILQTTLVPKNGGRLRNGRWNSGCSSVRWTRKSPTITATTLMMDLKIGRNKMERSEYNANRQMRAGVDNGRNWSHGVRRYSSVATRRDKERTERTLPVVAIVLAVVVWLFVMTLTGCAPADPPTWGPEVEGEIRQLNDTSLRGHWYETVTVDGRRCLIFDMGRAAGMDCGCNDDDQ